MPQMQPSAVGIMRRMCSPIIFRPPLPKPSLAYRPQYMQWNSRLSTEREEDTHTHTHTHTHRRERKKGDIRA